MLGTYINNTYGPRYYGKAMNIIAPADAPPTTRRCDSYDLLLMPTTPMKATPLPAPGRHPRRVCRARA